MIGILIGIIVLLILYRIVYVLYDKYWDKGLSVNIKFRDEYCVEGEESALVENVANDKSLIMPVVEVSFNIDKRLQFSSGENSSVSDRTYRRDVFALSFRQKITRKPTFKCVHRGYFYIDNAGITAKNLFLRNNYVMNQAQNTEFYVLPRPIPTSQVMIPYAQIMGAVISRKKVYDDPFEFAGLRDYTKSDPMKYINWKATARTGKMLVNIHESTLSQKIILLLDMEGQGVHQADVLNEGGVRIACSLTQRLLASGVNVELHSNGTDEITGKPAEPELFSGSGNELHVCKKFACIQSGNDLPSVVNCLNDGESKREDYIVLISRNPRDEVMEEFIDAVGTEQALRIIPYRGEKPRVEAPKNINLLWMEI